MDVFVNFVYNFDCCAILIDSKKFVLRFRFYWRPPEGFYFHWGVSKNAFYNLKLYAGGFTSTGGIQMPFLGGYNSTGGIQFSSLGVFNSIGGILISFLGGYNFHWRDSDILPGGL